MAHTLKINILFGIMPNLTYLTKEFQEAAKSLFGTDLATGLTTGRGGNNRYNDASGSEGVASTRTGTTTDGTSRPPLTNRDGTPYTTPISSDVPTFGDSYFDDSFGERITNSFMGLLGDLMGIGVGSSDIANMRFNHNEAVINRSFEQFMSNTAFQRQVADMQKAGINPALMYNNGSSGASSAAGGPASVSLSGASGNAFDKILSLFKLKQEKELAEKGFDLEKYRIDVEAGRSYNDDKHASHADDIASRQLAQNIRESEARIADLQNQAESRDYDNLLKYSQEILNRCQAGNIAVLLPYQQALINAQTATERAKARLDILQAGFNANLWTPDFIKNTAKSLEDKVIIEDADAAEALLKSDTYQHILEELDNKDRAALMWSYFIGEFLQGTVPILKGIRLK